MARGRSLAEFQKAFADEAIGQIATVPRLFGWYPSLIKPWFTPPDPVFGGGPSST